jgi:hypothetical protein
MFHVAEAQRKCRWFGWFNELPFIKAKISLPSSKESISDARPQPD